ncbi:Uncharacterized protein YrrD, contains PRC-barrel domain [Bacillus sp. OV322]|uniref:PRC-barrel domain-containing protein n=1 Tax=Bacillus sp. OV322 TaxID=1882764 RepID=UPI0008E631C7|nr:PRC-barrel domain-containing protein [Bacillus sp. OV322]SFC36378.1 Uncharacterized protein YrrD, contains PRC-barrel domain [Bacillus sp. OV322]
MCTFSLIKGLPVYSKDGERVGMICDLAISGDGHVAGVIVHQQAFFKKTYYIPLGQVYSFGEHGVVIEDYDPSLRQIKCPQNLQKFSGDHLFGKMLMSESGEELGLLHDVYFQEKMGTIVAYETTDGFFSEISEGRRMVECGLPPALGKDAIIVSVYDL